MINFTNRTAFYMRPEPTDMRNGFVLYEKWFDDGRFLKPEFQTIRKSHRISRETLILLMSAAVQTKILI